MFLWSFLYADVLLTYMTWDGHGWGTETQLRAALAQQAHLLLLAGLDQRRQLL